MHINDTVKIENIAYLIQYDTAYGKFHGQITVSGPEQITLENTGRKWEVRVTNQSRIGKVDWNSSGTECVIEATGAEANALDARQTFNGGLEHVIVTNTRPQADFTLVLGVNDDAFDPSKHQVISSSICDATAIAPVLRVIHDSWGIEHCFITTVHPWLPYQNLNDGPIEEGSLSKLTSRYYALGRASGANIIPKLTTVGMVLESLLPALKDRVCTFSYRVPTSVVCTADMTLALSDSTTSERLDRVLRSVDPRLVRCSNEMLVSTDYVGERASAVIDLRWLNVIRGKYVKLVLWYDNEVGYASRVVDILDRIK